MNVQEECGLPFGSKRLFRALEFEVYSFLALTDVGSLFLASSGLASVVEVYLQHTKTERAFSASELPGSSFSLGLALRNCRNLHRLDIRSAFIAWDRKPTAFAWLEAIIEVNQQSLRSVHSREFSPTAKRLLVHCPRLEVFSSSTDTQHGMPDDILEMLSPVHLQHLRELTLCTSKYLRQASGEVSQRELALICGRMDGALAVCMLI